MKQETKTEIWFYHLERAPLERVLPDLLEKTCSKGWRALVRVATEERLDLLDTHLWTYRPDSFLAHGSAKDGHEQAQPIYLTVNQDNPNQADVLFLVDGAAPGDPSSFKRCITIFDGRDAEAVNDARTFWQQAKADGFAVMYWQQTSQGKWQQKA